MCRLEKCHESAETKATVSIRTTLEHLRVLGVDPDHPTPIVEITAPVSGVITGTFVMPNGSVLRGFRGVVLQKQNAAYGYFRGLDQCGYFSLTHS